MSRLYDAGGRELFECSTCHGFFAAENMTIGETDECEECAHARMLEARREYIRERPFSLFDACAEIMRAQADAARLAAKERA